MEPASLYSEKYLEHFRTTVARLSYTALCFLQELHGKGSGYETGFLYDLVERMRLNFKAVEKLLPEFQSDKTFKQPLSLLFRAIAADTLVIFYLDQFSTHQKSLRNEIKVLEWESLKAALVIMKFSEEINARAKHPIPHLPDSAERKKKIVEWSKAFPEFFDGDALVKEDELRRASDKNLLSLMKVNGHMTEAKKAESLLEHQPEYAFVYIFYKLLSQYEHVSPNSKMMLIQPESNELTWWSQVAQFSTKAIHLCIQMIAPPNKNHFLAELDLIQTDFDKVI